MKSKTPKVNDTKLKEEIFVSKNDELINPQGNTYWLPLKENIANLLGNRNAKSYCDSEADRL